jgi:hypothetical protein
MENSDFAKGLLRGVAQTLIAGYNLAQELMYDPVKLAMINGVLISKDFPPMRKNDLLGSLMGIADKAATYVTTTSEGATLRLEAKAFADEFESKYFRLSKIDDLSNLELENVLMQFLMDNGLVPMQDAWLASATMTNHGADCGPFLVCRMNERAVASASVIKSYASKLLSMFFSLTWSTYHRDLSYQTLIDATYKAPGSAETCVDRFPDTPMYCDIFTQLDKKNEMSLSYEHTEL